MSKKLGVILSSISVTLVICYLAYQSKGFNETFNEYIYGYLDNFQKYLFLINILIFPFFLFLQRGVNEPLIWIRLKRNTFYFILKNSVIKSAALSVFIYFNFILWGLVFGLETEFSAKIINLLFQLFLFVFACYISSYSVCFGSNRMVLGPTCILILNSIFLMILYAINFYLKNNLMPEHLMIIIYYIYLFVMIFGGLLYLYKGAQTKECLILKDI